MMRSLLDTLLDWHDWTEWRQSVYQEDRDKDWRRCNICGLIEERVHATEGEGP